MNAQALTLDIFDDEGQLLLRDFPDRDDLPDLVKTAEETTREAHDLGEFAVVLTDGERMYPRYLMHTPGHTALSVLYFGQTRNRLPEEAQKVAASRLAMACAHHQMGTPSLLVQVAEGLPAGDPVVFIGNREVVKIAEAPREREEISYALGNRYPLGSVGEIKAADRYFVEHAHRFSPEDRHQYAYNVDRAAADAGLSVSEELSKAAGVDWNPAVQAHILVRRHILAEREAPLPHSLTLEKLASHVGTVPAPELAAALTHFDRQTGLDRSWGEEIFDPYESVLVKVAAKKDHQRSWVVHEDDSVSDEDLTRATANARTMQTIASLLGYDFSEKFQKDSLAAFQSQPPRIRALLARILTDRRDVP